MIQGTCWASPEVASAPRYASTPKSVQISRYAPTKIHVGVKARSPLRRSRWTRAKTRIIAIIITTQIARNNAAPMPIVRPMPIPFAVLDCQIRIAHDAPAGGRSPPAPPAEELPSILVSVVVPDPGLRSFQTLLISPLRNQVEVVVGSVHHIDSPRVARVGVKNRAALVFVEHADSLTVRVVGVHSRLVVERRSTVGFLRGKGRLIVKVEIALERGDPLEAPSHALFERLDLGKLGPRNGHKGHIAVIEVNPDAVEIIGPEREVRTPFVPLRGEHKVIDDELAPVFEKLGQCLLAARPVEDILLVNLLPWEFAPLPAQ